MLNQLIDIKTGLCKIQMQPTNLNNLKVSTLFTWSPTQDYNGGSGGGGNIGEATPFGEVDANQECQNLGPEVRQDLLNTAFVAARTAAGLGGFRFVREYPTGSIFPVILPNGSIIRGIVSEPMATTVPIISEASNTCE